VDTGTNQLKAQVNGSAQAFLTNPIVKGSLPTVGQQSSSSSGATSMTGALAQQDYVNPI
jgi:hypothetical protein